MNYNMLASSLSRVCFVVALCLVAAGAAEAISNLFGYTIAQLHYRPGRLLELAAALSTIVIAVLLRQIRDELRKQP